MYVRFFSVDSGRIISFGLGIGDIIAVSERAWNIYKLCTSSSPIFAGISDKVASLHVVLKQNKENLEKATIDQDEKRGLGTLIKGCDEILSELETLVTKYDKFSMKEQSVWDQLRLDCEDVSKLQARLDTSVNLLTSFNVALINYTHHIQTAVFS